MDAKILQLPLERLKALDERQFDGNLIARQEALHNVPRAPERHMASSQYLRRRYGLNERWFSLKNVTCG